MLSDTDVVDLRLVSEICATSLSPAEFKARVIVSGQDGVGEAVLVVGDWKQSRADAHASAIDAFSTALEKVEALVARESLYSD